jgi:hypothetical protein
MDNISHNVKIITILLIILVTGYPCLSGQNRNWNKIEDIRQVTEMASCRSWETLKEDKGVILKSRWLYFGDSLKTREISSCFIVNSNLQNVLDNLKSPQKMLEWNEGLRSMKLLKKDGSVWITHTIYDIPYPFSQQDLVVKNVMVTDKQKVTILLSSLPEFIKPIKNTTRQKFYFGKWELTPINDMTTEVRFSALSFSESRIPRIIRDPIIQNKLFHSFLNLKEQTRTDIK